MILAYQCDIGCDICNEIFSGEEHLTIHKAGMSFGVKRDARAAGWIRRRGPDGAMKDICPQCQDKLKADGVEKPTYL